MEHIAIDLGSRESQICVRQGDGAIVEETQWPTASLGKYLARRPKSRVVVESCAEAFSVADAARAAGHDVSVVPASLARVLGIGHRGLKNDVRDARNLSDVSCRIAQLPIVHVPAQESRDRKAMCGAREALIGTRTKLVNTARGWLRSRGLPPLRGGSLATFATRFRKHVEAKTDAPTPKYVERSLGMIEHLNVQIVEADEELEAVAANDPICRLLMTVPGVGPVTAVRFVAAIDDVSRFGDAHSLEGYLGLTPGENSSSDRKRTTGITKAGAPRVRWALVQAAWTARRCRPNDPMVQWSRGVEARRGKKVAVMALVRKMAGVMYAMWRDGTRYDPSHTAKPPTSLQQ